MPKALKIALIGLGVVLILVVGVLVAAAALFDPNDYRDRITQAVKQQTGRDLQLGHIELRVFPWLEVQLDDVRLSNAAGFGEQPMAEVARAGVGVQVLPLLRDRQVKVSTLTLEGLKLDLAKDKNGQTNWADLIKPQAEQPQEKSPGPRIESIDVAGVALRDAHIVYRDAQSGQAYRLEKLNLETGSLQPGKPVDVEASLTAIAEAQKLSADLKFSGTALADLVAQRASVQGLALDLAARGEGLNAGAKITGDAAVNLESQELDLSGLKIDFKAAKKDLDAQGSLSAKVKAALRSQQFTLSGLDLQVNAKGAAIPGGSQTLKLASDVVYDAAQGALDLRNARITAAGLNVETTIRGEGLSGPTPRLSGPITVAPFNPRVLLKILGMADIKTQDPKVLGNASFSARYSGSFKSAQFDDLKLVLDDTRATGSLAVREFATQALQFALKLDRIDADRYLPPAVAGPAEPPKPTATKADPQALNRTEIPLQALEKLNASGTLGIGELKIKGATLKNVQVKLDGPKGAAKVVQLDTQAYGGTLALASRIVPGARPGYSLDTTLSAMQIAPVLQNFVGKDYVSGLGNVKLDLNSAGATVGDVRRALNGEVSLNFQNGAVKGFNLGQVLRKGQALIKGQPFNATEPQQTDFTAITFAATIVNGVLKSDQLNAQSPLFRVVGSGQIDLAQETINYLAQPTVVGTSKGQGGKALDELAGLTIPIKLTGSLFKPSYKLDLQTALKQKAGDELRGKLADKVLGGDSGQALSDAEFKQKANEKLNKELGRGLEKLFGNRKKESAAPVPSPAPETPAPSAPPTEAAPAPAAPPAAAPAPAP